MNNRSALNRAIKRRSKDVFRDNLGIILLIALAYTFINEIIEEISSNNIFISLMAQFLSVVIAASSFCFYFRTYNKAEAEIKDTYEIFTYRNSMNKLMSIFVAMAIIRMLLVMLTWILLFIPVLNLFSVLVSYFISFLFYIVYSLFVINQDYPTVYYLRASAKYMGPYIINYFIFVLGVMLIPTICISLLRIFGKLGYSLSTLLRIPLTAFVSLCQVGYIESIVPDEWYTGTAYFE